MFRSTALIATLTLAACAGGPSASQIQQYCDTSCTKLDTCDLLGGLSKETCLDSCAVASDVEGCETTQEESDACLDAFATATCDELRSGNPLACERTCDETDDTNDTTETDTTDPGTDPVGACADLQACCDTMDDANKQICEIIVDAGFLISCESSLQGYIDSEVCEG